MSEERKLPEGVTHVSGNVYRVDLSVIQFADGGFNKESNNLTFTNIRHALVDQHLLGRGMSAEEMSELRERIRTEGLLHRPMLRWFDGGVQVVMGERRIRSLMKLVHDNAKCYDRNSGKTVPAKDLYSTIEVEIHELDDRQAYKFSFSETESVAHFGDGAKIAAIDYFRKCGLTDKDIIFITGLGPEWLNLADKLTPEKLGKKCFAALANDEMSLPVAMKLIENFPDEESREAAFKEWQKHAFERWLHKKKELEKKVEKAAESVVKAEMEVEEANAQLNEVEQDAAELADALEMEAEALEQDVSAGGINVKRKLEKAREKQHEAALKQEKAAKRKVAADTKVKAHIAKKPKVTPKDIGDKEDQPLTLKKMLKFWYEPLASLIKTDGCDSTGNKIEELDMWDVRLAKMLCERFRKGDPNIVRLLISHYRKKNKAE